MSTPATDTTLTTRQPQQPLTVLDSIRQIGTATQEAGRALAHCVATSTDIPSTGAKLTISALAVYGVASTLLGQGRISGIAGFFGVALGAGSAALKLFQQEHRIHNLELLNDALTTANAQLVTSSRGPIVEEPQETPRGPTSDEALSPPPNVTDAIRRTDGDSSTHTTPATTNRRNDLSQPPERPASNPPTIRPPMRFGRSR